MAHSNQNCLHLFVVIFIVVFLVKNSFELEKVGDFSDEDYEDYLEEQDPKKPFEHSLDEQSKPKKSLSPITHHEFQAYLMNIQPKVLTSNDVFTVKDKKPVILKSDKKIEKLDKLDDSLNIQSDQPAISVQPQRQNTSLVMPTNTKPTTMPVNPKPSSSHSMDYNTADPLYPVPTQRPNTMWNCEFKAHHNCGIVNDFSVGEYFHLENRNFFRNFNWDTWYLVLNGSTLPSSSGGARLITPYMDTKNVSQGCLSIQYVTVASGFRRVTLYQQDQGNHCVWSTESKAHDSSSTPVNNQLDFTVNLYRGSPRFFLEIFLDHSDPNAKRSVFALANLRLSYRPCFNNNANQCKPEPSIANSDVRMP